MSDKFCIPRLDFVARLCKIPDERFNSDFDLWVENQILKRIFFNLRIRDVIDMEKTCKRTSKYERFRYALLKLTPISFVERPTPQLIITQKIEIIIFDLFNFAVRNVLILHNWHWNFYLVKPRAAWSTITAIRRHLAPLYRWFKELQIWLLPGFIAVLFKGKKINHYLSINLKKINITHKQVWNGNYVLWKGADPKWHIS